MFRPQFPLPPPPAGYVWQPCLYQFDSTNTPAFSGISLTAGQETGYIPLHLDDDAPFVLLAVRMLNANVGVQLWDPHQNELMDSYVLPNVYAGAPPLTTVLEGPGIECPRGSVFNVRLQGQ